jgi:hypothetical protein
MDGEKRTAGLDSQCEGSFIPWPLDSAALEEVKRFALVVVVVVLRLLVFVWVVVGKRADMGRPVVNGVGEMLGVTEMELVPRILPVLERRDGERDGRDRRC